MYSDVFNYPDESKFRMIYQRLFSEGHSVSPRGEQSIELENFNDVFPPYVRFVNFKARKLRIDYIKKEFLWYLRGDPKDLSIQEHAKLWGEMVQTDGTIQSNYGQYIFGLEKQFDVCYDELRKDPCSRRASIIILKADQVSRGGKDVPCTYSINFRIRNEYLNMSVLMRSQDSIWGFGSDLPIFSFIHEMMYVLLNDWYPTLKYGDYFHYVNSFHVYKRHYDMVKEINKSTSEFEIVRCPEISCAEEVRFLKNLEYDNIPDRFKFTRWLLNMEVRNDSK